ncbi:terminase small subunit [Clostridium senegalense]
MARTRSPDRDKAFEIYKEHNGQIDLVKIAEILNISPGTVRGWKNKDKWNDQLNGTFQKEKKVVKNTERSKRKVNKINKVKKEPIAEEVEEVMKNDELNDSERLFCVIYSRCFNATKAYLKAYTCTYETAMVNGCKLLRKAKIKEQIDSLTQIRLNKEALKRSVIQKYIDIAFADIGDYIKFGKKHKGAWTKNDNGEDIPVMDPETGEQKIIEYNYLDLKESSLVDTTLINEVSEGKDGIKFKLADKMKALDFLTKHCNLLSDEEKIKLDIENKKLQNNKIKAEITKITGEDELEVEDDGFLDALNGRATEVWNNE